MHHQDGFANAHTAYLAARKVVQAGSFQRLACIWHTADLKYQVCIDGAYNHNWSLGIAAGMRLALNFWLPIAGSGLPTAAASSMRRSCTFWLHWPNVMCKQMHDVLKLM